MLQKQSLHQCPCCGWKELDFRPYENYPLIPDFGEIAKLTPPYSKHWGSPSYQICDCCGFEFGQDDDPGTANPVTFSEYRREWINDEDATWTSPEKKPKNWSLQEQLMGIGISTSK